MAKAILHIRHKKYGHQYLLFDDGTMYAREREGHGFPKWDDMGQIHTAEEMKDFDSIKKFYSEFDYELKELRGEESND